MKITMRGPLSRIVRAIVGIQSTSLFPLLSIWFKHDQIENIRDTLSGKMSNCSPIFVRKNTPYGDR